MPWPAGRDMRGTHSSGLSISGWCATKATVSEATSWPLYSKTTPYVWYPEECSSLFDMASSSHHMGTRVHTLPLRSTPVSALDHGNDDQSPLSSPSWGAILHASRSHLPSSNQQVTLIKRCSSSISISSFSRIMLPFNGAPIAHFPMFWIASSHSLFICC